MARRSEARRSRRSPWRYVVTGPGRVAVFCGVLTLAAAAGGCQREPRWNLAPVEGAVTRAGRPLANIQVVFLADVEAGTQGPRASGITDQAGRYRLRTVNGDEGAVMGHHRVRLVDWLAKPETPAEKRRVPPS